MKKTLSIFLIFCLIFAITACNTENQTEETATANTEPNHSESTSTSSPSVSTNGEINHNNKENSEQVEFFARIIDGGQSLFVKGDDYSGFAHLPKEISADDYKKGDYVAITFPGYIMESYPPQIHVTAIRHLTEEEIATLPNPEEKRICLQYMGIDEGKIIGICENNAYGIALSDLQTMTEMTFGDYFTVVYEEQLPSSIPTMLLFIKEFYRSDENGEPMGTFRAVVKDKGDRAILVKTDDEQMLRLSDQYWVSLPEGVLGENFDIGDEVEITFVGLIRESYPAQIDGSAIFVVTEEE